jgi:hypothetical protein
MDQIEHRGLGFRARSRDPSTSRIAAHSIASDGTLARMLRVTWDALVLFPGLTSNELEAVTGNGDGKLRKRLGELLQLGWARKGEIRRSAISGKPNYTWWPVLDKEDGAR